LGLVENGVAVKQEPFARELAAQRTPSIGGAKRAP
jgi:hypothetical protein